MAAGRGSTGLIVFSVPTWCRHEAQKEKRAPTSKVNLGNENKVVPLAGVTERDKIRVSQKLGEGT
jgi:hypothetical protein